MAQPELPPDLHELARLVAVGGEGPLPQRTAAGWAALLDLARAHRVEGLLVARMLGPDGISDPHSAERIARRRLLQHGRSMKKLAALREIAEALTGAGIPFLLLKGASIAERYYPEPLDRRAMDIDLLVRDDDLRAIDLMRACGFVSYANAASIAGIPPPSYRRVSADHTLWRERDGIVLELHWRLSRYRSFPPWDAEFLFQQAEPLRLEAAGIEVRVLRAPVQLVYLACHGARHLWCRLKWLVDLDRMLARMSEGELAEAARLAAEAQCERAFHTGLLVCHTVFGSPLPDSFCPRHADPVLLQAMLAALIEGGMPGEHGWRSALRTFRARLRLRGGAAYRAEVVRHHLVSPVDVARHPAVPLPLLTIAGPVLRLARALR